MKKTIYLSTIVALILAMTFALSACGGQEEAADTAAEDATEETATTPEATKSDAELGDLYSGSFSIDGTVFTLPCDIKEFYDLGYAFEKDDTLSDGYSSSGRLVHSNGDSIVLSVYNTTGSDKKFSECATDSVYIYSDDCKTFDVEFPGGIHMNDSIKDVEAAWGKPTDLYDEENAYYMTYKKEFENYEKVEVKFNFFDDKMNSVDIHV